MNSVVARRALAVMLAAVVGAVLLPATAASAEEIRPIHFPVEGSVSYIDDFGAPRAGHPHQGNDLMATSCSASWRRTTARCRGCASRIPLW